MKKYVFLFLSLSLVSCTQNDHPRDSNSDIFSISYDSLSDGNIIEEEMNCNYIKLQTTQDCRMSDIKRIYKDDSLLFILDSKDYVYLFDTCGTFIRKIGDKGKARNEYLKLIGMYIDKKNDYVNILDFSRKDFIRYDYLGNFIDRISVPFDKINTAYDFVNTEDFLCCVNCNKKNVSEYNFTTLKWDNLKTTNLLKFSVTGKYLSIWDGGRICKNSMGILAVTSFSDTIYKIGSNAVDPVFVLNGPLKECKVRDFENLHPDVELDICRDFLKEKKTTGLCYLYATDSIITFRYGFPCQVLITYDIKEKRGKKMLLSNDFLSSNIIFSDNECFIAVKTIIDCKRIEKERINADFWNKILDSKEDDNPIIIIYK